MNFSHIRQITAILKLPEILWFSSCSVQVRENGKKIRKTLAISDQQSHHVALKMIFL